MWDVKKITQMDLPTHRQRRKVRLPKEMVGKDKFGVRD